MKMFTFQTFSDLQLLLIIRYICVFRFNNECWIFSGLTFHEKTELSMMAECCHLLAEVPDSHEKKLTKCIILVDLPLKKIVENKKRAFVFERKMRRTHEMCPLQNFRWRLPIADNGGQFSLTNKEFKEFYWNKDKFQSQSLIFQEKKEKKHALGFSTNISWLFSQALVAYTASCTCKKNNNKPDTTGHFGTIKSYINTPVLTYCYFCTVGSLCLLVNLLTKHRVVIEV